MDMTLRKWTRYTIFFGKFTEAMSHEPPADETFQNHYEESLQSFVLK
jgi:hypothetical protein